MLLNLCGNFLKSFNEIAGMNDRTFKTYLTV